MGCLLKIERTVVSSSSEFPGQSFYDQIFPELRGYLPHVGQSRKLPIEGQRHPRCSASGALIFIIQRSQCLAGDGGCTVGGVLHILLQTHAHFRLPSRAHDAIPSSRSLATRYSCGRSPLTRLQWAHSNCRFSMLS